MISFVAPFQWIADIQSVKKRVQISYKVIEQNAYKAFPLSIKMQCFCFLTFFTQEFNNIWLKTQGHFSDNVNS